MKYLIPDRDPVYTAAFRDLLRDTVPAEKSGLVGTVELAGSDRLGSLRDDIRADFADTDAPRPGGLPNRAAPRGSGPAPLTAGASTVTPTPVAPHESRTLALDVDIRLVARLANGTRHRQAGDRRRLASPGLPLV